MVADDEEEEEEGLLSVRDTGGGAVQLSPLSGEASDGPVASTVHAPVTLSPAQEARQCVGSGHVATADTAVVGLSPGGPPTWRREATAVAESPGGPPTWRREATAVLAESNIANIDSSAQPDTANGMQARSSREPKEARQHDGRKPSAEPRQHNSVNPGRTSQLEEIYAQPQPQAQAQAAAVEVPQPQVRAQPQVHAQAQAQAQSQAQAQAETMKPTPKRKSPRSRQQAQFESGHGGQHEATPAARMMVGGVSTS